MTVPDFDLFVIGGGSGGVRAARMAAQRGARVALVEMGGIAGLGGTCVNVGCIPKKLYSYAAHYGEAFEEARNFGWESTAALFNWDLLKANRKREISRLNDVYLQLLAGAGVRVLIGQASLAGPNSVALGADRYSASNILIATGGRPQVPQIVGREHVLTSNDMFDLTPFPQRLLVVGGGYIACEFASIFNGLGAEVTQIHRGELLLRGFDLDVRKFLGAELVKSGVALRLNADVQGIARGPHGIEVELKDGASLAVDAVLYATGRVPRVAVLELDAVGVEQGPDGAIIVNDHFQSSVASIYAIGDVTSRVQLTPVALGEAMALVDHLFGPAGTRLPRSMSYQFIPSAVFTHPSVGTVGYTEEAARQKFGRVRIYRSEFKPLRHTISGSSERTLVKLVVDDASDRVVGLHMVGPDAGEVVQGFAVAMKAGATKALFDSTVGIHPTLAEEFVTLREAVSDGPDPGT